MTGSRLTACGVVLAVLVSSAACSNPEKEKAEHVAKGDSYAAEKKDTFAAVEYASAVKIDPKYGEAHLKLAQTYERLNDVRGAFSAYIRAADALPSNRDAQVKAIEVMLLSGRFEDAKARAAALVTRDPGDVKAHLLQASAMAAVQETDGALALVQQALRLAPRSSEAYISLGTIRVQRGEMKDAEAAFREATVLDPSSASSSLALADFFAKAGRLDEAERQLEQTLASEPKHLLANRMLARLFMATNRIKEAEQPLKTIAQESKIPITRFELADYYIGVNRDAEATDLLNALSKDAESFAAAQTRLAALDYTRKRSGEAHARLDALLRKMPNHSEALVMKAQWFLVENKADEAGTLASKAVAAEPQSFAAHEVLARTQEARNQPDEAMKSYQEALRLNPRVAGARAALSRLNLAARRPDVALRYAEEARRAEPQDAAALVLLVRSLMVSGNLARAESELQLLVKNAPDLPLTQTLLGDLQFAKNNTAGARAAFERALTLAPGNLQALSGLTATDLRDRNPKRAVARLEGELAKEPSSAGLLTLAAQAYSAAGDQVKAEQALRRAVTSNPNFMTGYAMLSGLYVRQGRLDQARAEYEAMAKLNPTAVGPKTMIGILLEAQGRRDEARKIYEEIVGRGADTAAVAANNLAYIYAEQNTNLDMALQLATAAKPKLPEDPNVDDTIGWVYYKKDLASLAIGPLEESIRKRPNNAETLYHLGLAHAKVGNKAKARDALTRAMAIVPNIGGDDARKALAAVSE